MRASPLLRIPQSNMTQHAKDMARGAAAKVSDILSAAIGSAKQATQKTKTIGKQMSSEEGLYHSNQTESEANVRSERTGAGHTAKIPECGKTK